jgi:hypothetical protein
MTNDNSPASSAIVFSCDEAYAFLARGLVLSLADVGFPNRDVAVVLIDIGCERETLSWMQDRGIRIVPFDPKLIPQTIMSVIKPVQRAQAMRPWLPELLPQFQHLVWLDCDLWVQNGEFMSLMIAGAQTMPDAVVVAPANSHYHASVYSELHEIISMQLLWYTSCYEPYLANKAASTLSYSSGVFSMRRTSPIWALWQKEAEFLYPAMWERNQSLMHLVEQIALNIVIVRNPEMIVRLDPLYNFHCNVPGVMRVPGGRVVTNIMVPPREVGVVHLANWSHLKKDYLDLNLLYRSGDYLSPAERTRIAG